VSTTPDRRRSSRGRRIARAALIVLALAAVQIVAGGVVLYSVFDLRPVFTGGGGLRLAHVDDAFAQAELVREHREAQRRAALSIDAAAPETLAEPAATAAGIVPERLAAPSVDVPSTDVDEPPAGPDQAATTAVMTVGAQNGTTVGGWPDFRGPDRDGHYPGRIRTSWPASGLPPLWKQPGGGGYASFTAAAGRAFTIEQRGRNEVVAAYDVLTGRELWTAAWPAFFQEWMGGDGPRATPVWADGLVYALGATGELRCVRADTGEVVWGLNILRDNGASNLDWGMAASPLVLDDVVIVLPGGRRGRSVVAYDRRTGERRWSALDDQASYAAPMLVTLAGEPQLLIFAATRLVAITPDGSRELWDHPWPTPNAINAAQPLVVDDTHVFISSSYGTGAALLEVSRSGNRLSAREVWRNIRMKNRFTSSVLHEGYIYGLDENILACLDAATGALQWKAGRYGYGQVMLADGHLIVLTEAGDLVLVRATPERLEEVGHSPALEGKTWNHPAIVDGILLVRNLREMAAFDLRR